jgi:hypothetical protein
VLAIACKRSASRPVMGIVGLVVGRVSVSFSGMAGWFVMTKGPLNTAPRSGFFSAAIPGIPTEVHIEVHEVGNPLDFGQKLKGRSRRSGSPRHAKLKWGD